MAWMELVEEYVALRLSKPEDTLIAIAGVVTRVATATGFNYFYGLWHDIHNPTMIVSQLLWTAQVPSRTCYFCQDGLAGDLNWTPSFSWASAFGTRLEHCVTFHDRKLNLSTNRSRVKRSTFVRELPEENTTATAPHYVEILVRNFRLQVDWGNNRDQPTDLFAKTNLAFPTKLRSLIATENAHPVLVLGGPVRKVEMKCAGAAYGQWTYPWPHDTKDLDEEEAVRRKEWFFPDTKCIRSPGLCLTLAKWKRLWNGRWYTAGLVLCPFRVKIKGIMVTAMRRTGYFEHSWSYKHPQWDDHGVEKTVLLI